MPQVTTKDDGTIEYSVVLPDRGVWTHASPQNSPERTIADLTNCSIFGDLVWSALGNKKFITTAFASGSVTLLCDYRYPGAEPVIILASTSGIVWKWDSAGGTWVSLRSGLSTTSTLWWAWQQYGTDLFITNPTDGVYRWDANTLVPVGAKPIAQCESDEAALWAGETADTTNYREGVQSMYVESAGAQTTMTYTPSTNFNAVTGRLSAADYASDKSPGTDFYHFKVMFSNTGTIDTTNTRVLMTDGDGDTLNFPYTVWDSDRSGTALTNPPVAGTWYDVYLPALDGTDSATFDASNIDTFAFAVDTSAGTLRMNVDDFYVIYATTMPAVSYLGEWRNILFGARTTANPDALYWSPTRAPDQWSALATAPIKGGGDSITALKPFFHQLTIGTDHHVHTLSGNIIGQTYPAYLFDINEVTDEAGISSHRSIVRVNNKLYWFYLGNIVQYSGTAVDKVSYQIEPTLQAVDVANLQSIVGARFRTTNELWWTYPRINQATSIVIKYNFIHQALLPSDLVTPLLYTTYESSVERLLAVDNTNRFVYRQNDDTPAYKHFGTNIGYVVELPGLGSPDQAVEWIEAFIAYLSNTGSITVTYRLADHLRQLSGVAYTTVGTINQAVAGELGRIRLGFPGKVCQLKITSTGVPFQLQFPVVVKARPLGVEQAYP